MFKSQLIELLGTIPADRYAGLRKFIDSPFHNDGATAAKRSQLIAIILGSAPDFQAAGLAKEQVYPLIYPGEPPVKGKLDKLMTEALKLVRSYIVVTESGILNNDVTEQIILAKYYREKNLQQRFKLSYEHTLNLLDALPVRDKDFFYKHYLIEYEYFELLNSYNERRDDLNLRNTIYYFDLFFILHKLELTVSLITQGQFTALELEKELSSLDDIIGWMRRDEFKETTLIRLYDFVIRTILEKDQISKADILAFRETIYSHVAALSPPLVRDFLALSRNFCIRRYNSGEEGYRRVIFDIFKEDLDAGWLYTNSGITPALVQSLSVCAIRNNELDWLRDFLEQHRYRIIHTDEPEKIYRHNMAHYYFEKKEYDAALDMLDASYEDFYYLLITKKLEIKIYYELQSDLLEYKIEAFKVFIFRQGNKVLSPLICDMNNAFVDMLRQMLHPSTYGNPARIQRLIDKIHQTKAIAEKEWLLEKLGGL